MNERLDISDFWSVMAGYGPAFWCGVVTAVIVFIAEAILCKRGIIFAGGEKKIAKARAAGNIIQATMVSCRYKDRGPDQNTANRMYIASYEYTVNGVKSENQSFQQASSLQGEFICITYRILKRCFPNMMLSRGIGKFYCILSRCLLHFVS